MGNILPIKTKHNFFKNSFFPSAIIESNNLNPNLRKSKSISVLKEEILNFIRLSLNSFFDGHNPKGIKFITRFRLGLSHLRDHKFKHSFQDTINHVTVVKILSLLLIFSSTASSLLMKGALPPALFVALIVKCWIAPIMI